jgi:carbamoyltransferase
MTGRRFHELFGGPPRDPETPLTQRHMDLAASIQAVTEEAVLRLGRELHRRTQQPNLVMAGGVALNCVANGRLLREGPFEHIWVQPAAGDAGGALGAALFAWYQLLDNPRHPAAPDGQHGSLLGPPASAVDIQALVAREDLPSTLLQDDEALADYVAGLLAEGKVVGWFQGRMEFGPRALGARSILGDPRSAAMQAVMNLKIKYRESFRPFAPAVLAAHAADWFELASGQDSPYMLIVAPVRGEHRTQLTPEQRATMEADPDLRHRVSVPRSSVPAVTHVDYSARLQTVDRERNPRFFRLIERFAEKTGCPMVVNTSFNVRGEPIVCTAADAYRCFLATDMDALVLDRHVLLKDQLAGRATGFSRDAHVAQFELD